MNGKPTVSTAPVYTLSVASELSGIPVYSVRQYVDKGLLIPFRKESRRHLFSQVDIDRLRFIHKLLDKDGLNVSGIKSLMALIPCWALKSCQKDEREKCQAFYTTSFPCWEASEKGSQCKNVNCRECDVYRIIEKYPDIKSLIKTFI